MKYILFLISELILVCLRPCFAQSLSKEDVIALNKKIKDVNFLGDFSCDRALAVQKGKYGFIDKKGKFVIPCANPLTPQICYPYPKFECGIYVGDNSIFNDKGRVLESLSDFNSFTNEGSYNGPIYIQQKEAFYIYKDGKKFGSYKNIHLLYGNILVSVVPQNGINYFGNNNKFYLSNIGSKNISEIEAQYVLPLKQNNGSYLFCIGRNNKLGIIDENFKEVVPFIFDSKCQNEGLVYPNKINLINEFVLEEKDCFDLYQVKDLSGKLILPDLYECINVGSRYIYAQAQRNTISAIKKVDGFCQVFDKKGNSIEEVSFGKNYFRMKNGFWQFEDKEGNKIFPSKIDCFSELLWDDYCIVNKGNNYFLINSNGEIVVDGLKGVYRDRDVLLKIYDKKTVKNAGLEGLSIADAHSYLSFPANSDRLLNLKYKIRSLDGKYDKIFDPSKKQGPYILIGPDGTNLSSMEFDWIGHFSEGLILVKLKDRYYYLNEKGEGLPDEVYLKK